MAAVVSRPFGGDAVSLRAAVAMEAQDMAGYGSGPIGAQGSAGAAMIQRQRQTVTHEVRWEERPARRLSGNVHALVCG